MKYTFLDEHGLQTAWEIIKLYFRSLSQTLTKNNIIDLKNIDNSNSNSGGLISLELSDKLASIEEGALVNYLIKVNNTPTPATEEGIVNIIIPTSISALDNDSEYLTEEDVTLLISDLLEGPTLLSDWAETNDLLITFIKNKPEIPSKVSDLLNDSNFVSKDYVDSADTTLTARIRAEEDFRMAADNNLVAADNALSGRISDIEEILPSGGSSTNTLTTMNWVRNKINAAVEPKADKSDAIGSLSLAINSTNFLITLSGTKVDGTSFTVQDVIDLPLESVVVSGSYDDTTKKVILTLQNGSVIDFSVADLVAGLQSEINSSNKLPSDLVDDTNCTHKFVTTLEKSQWNNKYDKPSGGIPKTDLDSSVQTSLGKADTALQEEVDPIFNASPASEITSLDIANWNNKYDKPSDGIPSTDMTQAVLNSLAAADTAVQPGDLANVATSGDYDDLLNKPDLSVYAESSDLATVATSGSYNDLTNKPDLSVYAETNDLATVATTGSYEDLLNKPTIPTIPNLSKGTTTGNGNAVTDISVSGHEITLTKGSTFLTEAPVTSVNGMTGDIVLDADDVKAVHNYSKEYLTFIALESGTFTFTYTLNNIQYSIDNGATWTTLPPDTASPTINVGSKIIWKATNPTATSSDGIGGFSATGNFNVCGNVMSLQFGDSFEGQVDLTGKDYAFLGLFYNNTKLINSLNLILPATTLSDNCYRSMFNGCTSLITAPTLPATVLTTYCYAYMFLSCSSLKTAPELPATTLAINCYARMFRDCTSLTAAPELPAITLANYCYEYMFRGCTSLTKVPATLPATTLANYCYHEMFYGCKFVVAPVLPATTLASSCYNGMFYNCTSLIVAPELPATTLASSCYSSMFIGCTSLITAPSILPATTLVQSCYSSMFYGCTSLTTAPEILPATTLANDCYFQMFYRCTSLKYIKCLATNISATSCTINWVNGVAATGTFIKADNMTSWTVGVSGIPSGWNAYTESLWKEVKHYELADISFSGNYNDLNNLPTLGTAASKDVPSSGNASTNEVVLGNDSRLTDARTPTSHSHGKLNNSGLVGFTESDASISNGDKLIIGDLILVSNLPAWLLNKSNIQFDGSTVNKALTPKGTWESFATLDNNGKVSSTQLPSYVDDVIEGYYNNGNFYSTYSNSTYSDLITGETGKIYVDLGNGNRSYRWSGSAYVEIVASPGTTDNIVEGSNNLFFTATRALEALSSSLNGKVDKVSSTDNAVARFDGTSGDIQNSGVTIDDNNKITTSGNIQGKDIIIQGNNTSNTTRYLTSDANNNIYASINSTTPLVINNTEVRRGASSSSINLGSSSYPWNNVYGKKFITNGGTSSQFVKGDGSLDNNTYVTINKYDEIISRGENLVINGNGYLKNNTNFSSFVFSEEGNSSPGSFYKTGKAALASVYKFPINPSLRYTVSCDEKALEEILSVGDFYICMRFYDVDGNLIRSQNHMFSNATKTELTQDLNPGDTTLHAENLSGWIGGNSNFKVSVWNYTNSLGYTYPAYTYTRTYVSYTNSDSINTTNNTITLSSPWNGATIPAGTKISRYLSGGTYKYAANGSSLTTWKTFSGYYEGVDLSGTNADNKFPPGAAYGAMGFLVNYANTTGTTYITNIVCTSQASLKDLNTKADKVSSATNNNFAALDANGNLKDSGSKASDFATAAQGALASSALQSISAGDNIEVSGNEVSVPTFPVNKIVPMYEKTYENYTCGSDNGQYIFFGNVVATSDNFYTPWEVYYTLKVTTSVSECQGEYDVRICYNGATVTYAIYNRFSSTSYYPIYCHYWLYHDTAAKYANRETYPFKFGVRLLSAYSATSLARTYNIKIWETRNCTVNFLTNIETYTEIYSSTNYASSYVNAYSRGLQETGDDIDTTTIQLYYSRVKAGLNGIKLYSLIMQDANGTWQSFTTGAGGTGTTKVKNPIGFALGSSVYYVSLSSDYAAGTNVPHGAIRAYQSIIDLRNSLNINTTANGMPGNLLPRLPVYIVGHLGNDGLFYLEDTWWTQYEPTTEDGKIYIKVVESVYADYENARCYRADLVSNGYAFWYKDGAFRRFYGKESLNSYSISDLEFVYRKTADGITLYNGNKAAINNIKGKTLAWNQLVQNGNFQNGTTGWRAYGSNGSLSVLNNTLTYTITTLDNNQYSNAVTMAAGITTPFSISGHVFILSYDAYVTKETKLNSFYFGGKYSDVVVQSGWNHITKINRSETNGAFLFIGLKNAGSYNYQVGDSISIKNVMCIDLTLIYGSGNEPSTPAQFEADYFRWFGKPLTYEPYDAGSLRNVQMQGLKTTGFNQWDEEWENGVYDASGLPSPSTSRIRCKNYIPVIGGSTYYYYCKKVLQDLYFRVRMYDANYNYVANDTPYSPTSLNSANYHNPITLPSNVRYIRFDCAPNYGSIYNNDICINISDTNKNGTYEPYEEHNVSVPVTTLTGKVNGQGTSVVIFPDGMKGVKNIKDEIKVENGVTKAIKRIGRVDLGTLTWTYSTNNSFMYSSNGSIGLKSTLSNLQCGLYSAGTVSSSTSDKTIEVYNDNIIRVKDLSYTDATTFQTAMDGVYLDYELAEPIEYVVDDFALPVSYTANKEGTEEIIPVTGEITVAPTLDITYGINISDIKGLPKVSSSDNGKTLLVVNGLWALVSVPTIYTGTGVPSDLDGNDGDIYIQTL